MVLIEQSQHVTKVFGRWPAFHDANVVGVSFDPSAVDGPTLHVQFEVFEMTDQVDAKGFYGQKNHTLVSLSFVGVRQEQVAQVSDKTIVLDLELSSIDPKEHDGRGIRVEMATSYGNEASFECRRVKVSDARPYDPAV